MTKSIIVSGGMESVVTPEIIRKTIKDVMQPITSRQVFLEAEDITVPGGMGSLLPADSQYLRSLGIPAAARRRIMIGGKWRTSEDGKSIELLDENEKIVFGTLDGEIVPVQISMEMIGRSARGEEVARIQENDLKQQMNVKRILSIGSAALLLAPEFIRNPIAKKLFEESQ